MNMKRNLIILGIVAVLAIAFVIAVPMLKPAETAAPTATPAPTEDPAKLSLSARTSDDVTEVTVENAKETYTLTKSGENFVVKGRESLSLDSTAANSVFYNAANVTGDMLVTENAADLSPYGLDKPQAKATAKYKDGTSATFLIGNMTAAGNSYYMMKQGDARVVTVWQNVGNTYVNPVDSLLAKQKITVTKDDITYLKVLKNGAATVELTQSSDISNVSISAWTITQPWKRSVDSEELDAYLTKVFALSLGDVVESKPADLSKYGLDKPKYELTLKNNKVTDVLEFGSNKDDYNTYVKFAGSDAVYTVSSSSLDFLNTTAYKLMDKMIILVNIPSALGVKFEGLGQSVNMGIEQVPDIDSKGEVRKDSNGKTMYTQKFTLDGKELADEQARAFYQLCIGLPTHSEIDPARKPADSVAPVATVTYTRNEEPKEIKVEFLPYDQDFYAVRYNGSVDFLIRKAKVQEVADAIPKLRDNTLVTPEPTEGALPTPNATEASEATPAPPASTPAPVKAPDSTGGTVMLVIILAGVVVAGVLLMIVMRKKK